jgi:hypothetical protein
MPKFPVIIFFCLIVTFNANALELPRSAVLPLHTKPEASHFDLPIREHVGPKTLSSGNQAWAFAPADVETIVLPNATAGLKIFDSSGGAVLLERHLSGNTTSGLRRWHDNAGWLMFEQTANTDTPLQVFAQSDADNEPANSWRVLLATKNQPALRFAFPGYVSKAYLSPRENDGLLFSTKTSSKIRIKVWRKLVTDKITDNDATRLKISVSGQAIFDGLMPDANRRARIYSLSGTRQAYHLAGQLDLALPNAASEFKLWSEAGTIIQVLNALKNSPEITTSIDYPKNHADAASDVALSDAFAKQYSQKESYFRPITQQAAMGVFDIRSAFLRFPLIAIDKKTFRATSKSTLVDVFTEETKLSAIKQNDVWQLYPHASASILDLSFSFVHPTIHQGQWHFILEDDQGRSKELRLSPELLDVLKNSGSYQDAADKEQGLQSEDASRVRILWPANATGLRLRALVNSTPIWINISQRVLALPKLHFNSVQDWVNDDGVGGLRGALLEENTDVPLAQTRQIDEARKLILARADLFLADHCAPGSSKPSGQKAASAFALYRKSNVLDPVLARCALWQANFYDPEMQYFSTWSGFFEKTGRLDLISAYLAWKLHQRPDSNELWLKLSQALHAEGFNTNAELLQLAAINNEKNSIPSSPLALADKTPLDPVQAAGIVQVKNTRDQTLTYHSANTKQPLKWQLKKDHDYNLEIRQIGNDNPLRWISLSSQQAEADVMVLPSNKSDNTQLTLLSSTASLSAKSVVRLHSIIDTELLLSADFPVITRMTELPKASADEGFIATQIWHPADVSNHSSTTSANNPAIADAIQAIEHAAPNALSIAGKALYDSRMASGIDNTALSQLKSRTQWLPLEEITLSQGQTFFAAEEGQASTEFDALRQQWSLANQSNDLLVNGNDHRQLTGLPANEKIFLRLTHYSSLPHSNLSVRFDNAPAQHLNAGQNVRLRISVDSQGTLSLSTQSQLPGSTLGIELTDQFGKRFNYLNEQVYHVPVPQQGIRVFIPAASLIQVIEHDGEHLYYHYQWLQTAGEHWVVPQHPNIKGMRFLKLALKTPALQNLTSKYTDTQATENSVAPIKIDLHDAYVSKPENWPTTWPDTGAYSGTWYSGLGIHTRNEPESPVAVSESFAELNTSFLWKLTQHPVWFDLEASARLHDEGGRVLGLQHHGYWQPIETPWQLKWNLSHWTQRSNNTQRDITSAHATRADIELSWQQYRNERWKDDIWINLRRDWRSLKQVPSSDLDNWDNDIFSRYRADHPWQLGLGYRSTYRIHYNSEAWLETALYNNGPNSGIDRGLIQAGYRWQQGAWLFNTSAGLTHWNADSLRTRNRQQLQWRLGAQRWWLWHEHGMQLRMSLQDNKQQPTQWFVQFAFFDHDGRALDDFNPDRIALRDALETELITPMLLEDAH